MANFIKYSNLIKEKQAEKTSIKVASRLTMTAAQEKALKNLENDPHFQKLSRKMRNKIEEARQTLSPRAFYLFLLSLLDIIKKSPLKSAFRLLCSLIILQTAMNYLFLPDFLEDLFLSIHFMALNLIISALLTKLKIKRFFLKRALQIKREERAIKANKRKNEKPIFNVLKEN